jgi:acyl-CoA-binding protein
MSTLLENFDDARTRLNALKETPPVEDLLELYALYKQSVTGDVSGVRPGMLDFKGRAKFDAWGAKQGMTKEEAMTAYIALVDRLAARSA